MKTTALVTLLLGLPAFARAQAPAAPAAGPRPLRVDDIFALKDVRGPALSPDGQWLAYTLTELDAKEDKARTDVWMAPTAGGEPLRLTSAKKPSNAPRFSPDGRFIAFLSAREGDHAQVYLLDRRGGDAQRLTDYKASVSDLAWSPDSKRLALVVHDVDPDQPAAEDDGAKKEDKPKPIVIRRRQFKRDGIGYLRELRDHIHVFDVASKQSVQVTSGPYDDGQPVWSPDGRSLAFASNRTADPDSNQNTDIFIVAAEANAAPRALTTWTGADDSPTFSPDGRHVAYVRGGDPKDMWYGTTRLGLVPVAGGAEIVLTPDLDRNVARPRFTPDGKAVLFLLEDGGNSHLARVGTTGGAIERVLGGERDVKSFDVVAGALAVLESQPQQPAEISLVAAAGKDAGALRRVTRANDAFLAGVALGRVERFRVQSADGTPVDVFLTLPPGATPGTRLPAILDIHGGPTAQFSTEFELEWQMLAAHGYAVVAANPRGSTGYGQAFSRAIWADWGNKDFADVMAAVDGAVARGAADPERLGVGGWSYGGILTNYVITKTGRFKAAISGASEANYLANYGTDHYQYEWETELGLPWRETELWLRLSPWLQVEKVTTPTLFLCGQDDVNVPLLNSEQLFQALKRLGRVDTELVIYPGEDHSIGRPSFRKDRFERYLAWYDKYLKR
jgi:dipeptidyl aminopeptidase/acylaminoacyl peptidase